MPAKTRLPFSTTEKRIAWHRENCPCQGKPQETPKQLAVRQKEVDSSGQYQTGMKTSFFRKPGSQNRSK